MFAGLSKVDSVLTPVFSKHAVMAICMRLEASRSHTDDRIAMSADILMHWTVYPPEDFRTSSA